MIALTFLCNAGCNRQGVPSPASSPSRGVENAVAPNANQGGAQFRDITEQAGISYRWEITAKRPLNLLQTIGNGCAFVDYNRDGNLDILLVGPQLALYRGDGKSRFTEVTQEAGLGHLTGQFLGCACGDYDNDGYPDVYISGYRTGLLLHNEQGQRFRDVTVAAGLKAQPWGTSCAFGDIDGDGKLDLYVGNYVQFGPDTVPQLCERSGQLTACGPLSYKPEFGVLYQNRGHGKFDAVTRQWGADKVSGKALGVAFAPIEGNGALTLVLSNDVMPGDFLVRRGNRFLNRGLDSGTAFTAEGKTYGGMGVDWGDYDNDGRLDLAVATFESEAKPVFHNDGNGVFEDRSQQLGLAEKSLPYVAFGMKWLDFNNDGWLDLVVSNGHIADNIADYDKTHTYRQPTLLFVNQAGERFEEIGTQSGADLSRPLVGRGLATGDIDNDGKVDVLLVDSEGRPALLHNQTEAVGHWLELRLVGTRCNRDGIGALVTVETDQIKLMRHCHSDGSYLSASDLRLHFGVGKAERVTVTVQWPSGQIDRFPDFAVDRQIEIREGVRHVKGMQ